MSCTRADTITYQGRPCKQGHDGLRYNCNHACVECTRATARTSSTKARAKRRKLTRLLNAAQWCLSDTYTRARRARPGELGRFLEEIAFSFVGDECLIWPFAGKYYPRVSQEGKTKHAHRIVCERVHGPPPSPQHQAGHTCGRGADGCVNPRHLLWITAKQNGGDMVLHGTAAHGSRQWRAKLTEKDVVLIRALRGKVSVTELARRFGVLPGAISKVQTRKTWRHVA
jgi:hypothetical protein